MSIPKTPVEFDYDLWTTEEGKCMVRIKATGEITEVERSVMQVLRSEEKRLRRTISPEQGPSREGKTAPTVLSLDMLPEDVADSSWLPHDVLASHHALLHGLWPHPRQYRRGLLAAHPGKRENAECRSGCQSLRAGHL